MLPYHANIKSVRWHFLSYPATHPLLLLLMTMSYKRELVLFNEENCFFSNQNFTEQSQTLNASAFVRAILLF